MEISGVDNFDSVIIIEGSYLDPLVVVNLVSCEIVIFSNLKYQNN